MLLNIGLYVSAVLHPLMDPFLLFDHFLTVSEVHHVPHVFLDDFELVFKTLVV